MTDHLDDVCVRAEEIEVDSKGSIDDVWLFSHLDVGQPFGDD